MLNRTIDNWKVSRGRTMESTIDIKFDIKQEVEHVPVVQKIKIETEDTPEPMHCSGLSFLPSILNIKDEKTVVNCKKKSELEEEELADNLEGEQEDCKFLTSSHDPLDISDKLKQDTADNVEPMHCSDISFLPSTMNIKDEKTAVDCKKKSELEEEELADDLKDEQEDWRILTSSQDPLHISDELKQDQNSTLIVKTSSFSQENEIKSKEDLNIRNVDQETNSSTCLMQSEVSSTKSNLKRKLLHSCAQCNKKFKSKSHLTKHSRIHSDEVRNKCSVCNKECRSKSDLVKHSRVHTGERPYSCSVCNKCFKQQGALYTHSHIHTGERNYCCSFCNKRFYQKSDLVQHSRTHSHLVKHSPTHTGELPYTCSVCNKGYQRNRDLVLHFRTHTGERPFGCSFCSKRYSSKSELFKHSRIHTGELPYCCSVCDKQFNGKSDLVRHSRTHTGERPYSCSICNKQFNLKCNLAAHCRIHTGELPYSCSVCNKQFNQKSNFIRHTCDRTG